MRIEAIQDVNRPQYTHMDMPVQGRLTSSLPFVSLVGWRAVAICFIGPAYFWIRNEAMNLDQSSYETVADETLGRLLDAIEETLGDSLDIDIEEGILTIELLSGGKYVINKHFHQRQIWVSSPVSGASHFAYDAKAEQWLSTRGEESLSALLARELSAVTGTPIDLS